MRAGAGKQKGSAFERKVGSDLSLWITAGERADLFSRTVLSGGKYTIDKAKGRIASGIPGDLMAAHPLAFDFLKLFMVECKHHRDIHLDQYLFDAKNSSLAKIINLAKKQAEENGLHYLVITKQNRKPTLVFMSKYVGSRMYKHPTSSYHILHGNTVYAFPLTEMLRIDPKGFLEAMA